MTARCTSSLSSCSSCNSNYTAIHVITALICLRFVGCAFAMAIRQQPHTERRAGSMLLAARTGGRSAGGAVPP